MKKVKGIDPREKIPERLYPGLQESKVPGKKEAKRFSGRFIPSVPLSWIQKALLLPGRGSGVKLALLIWMEKSLQGMEKDLVISSRRAQEEFGINVRTFTRALKELESLRLIRITEQGNGKSPRVTVLWEDEG